MTNQHRALEAITAAKITNKGHVAFLAMRENEKTGEEVPAHYRIAEALESNNLIAPNLPYPTDRLQDGSLVWELTTDWDMHVILREGKIFLGDKQLHPLVVKELSLNLMAALYAAVDYEEEEA